MTQTPPQGYRQIKQLTIIVGTQAEGVTRCSECPMFRDPDPYPCYCSLDFEHGIFAVSTKTVEVAFGPGIPDNCPLAQLRVEVERTEGT